MYSLFLVLYVLAGASSPQSIVVTAHTEDEARIEVESQRYCEVLDIKNVGLFDIEEEVDEAYLDALSDMTEVDLASGDFTESLIERIDREAYDEISVGSRVTCHLHPGLTFIAEVYDEAANWYHVACTVGGLKGWVSAADLELA